MIALRVVLTPIVPGREGLAHDTLAALGRPGPLAEFESLHFARWVVLGEARGRFPALARSRRALRMRYLLFTCAVDGSSDDFLEQLRHRKPQLTQDIWGSCVGFPGPADRVEFHRYLTHNTLDVPHQFVAYDHSVRDIKNALDLRARYSTLAIDAQGRSDDELVKLYTERLGAR